MAGPDDDSRPRVYLSYTRDSASDAIRQPLVKRLDEAGFESWGGMPPALAPGPVPDFVDTASAAVAIVSTIALSSTWMEAEGTALRHRAAQDPTFVLVVLRLPDVPLSMLEPWVEDGVANVIVVDEAESPVEQVEEVLEALASLQPSAVPTPAAVDSTLLTAGDHVGGVSALAWATLDGRPCVVTGDGVGTLRVIDVARDELRLELLNLHSGFVSAIQVGTLDGVPVAVSGGPDGMLHAVDLVDVEGVPKVTHRHSGQGPIHGLALAEPATGMVAICGRNDGTLSEWDPRNPERDLIIQAGHTGPVRAVAATNVDDRSVAASGGEDRRVRFWDVDNGQPIDEPRRGHTGAVQALATTTLDGRPVAVSGGDEGTLRVWELADGGPLGEPLDAHEGGVLALAATNDGARSLAVSAGRDSAVRVWDLSTRQQVGQRQHRGGEMVRALAVGSDDGRQTIVMGGAGRGVRLWDLSGGSGGATPIAPVVQDRVDWVSDARAKADLLQRRPLAQTLATRLNRLRAEEPGTSFLVHLDGRWGAGKSTVLDLLREELAEEWLVVEFDAWRQMRVGPPWWALLASLRQAIRDDLSWRGGLKLRVAEAVQRGRRGGPLYAVALIALLGLVLLLGFGVDLGGIDRTVSSILVVLGGLGTLLAGASAVSRFLLWDSAAGAKVFEQSQRDPMESIADHFAWLIARAGKPVVFFVDDLDRCSNEYVVALLDAVQTLVRDAPARLRRRRRMRDPAVRTSAAPPPAVPPPICHVVVAADGRWIRTSYEQEHAPFANAVAEPGRALGYLFLAKIFQLTVEVPSISAHRQDAFMRGLLRNAGPGDDTGEAEEIATQAAAVEQRVKESTSEAQTLAAYDQADAPVRAAVADKVVAKLAEAQIERSTEHALERFAPLLEANPRAMKLFVNAYGVARALQILEDNVVARDPLALWTILRTRWPGLADYIRDHPEAIGPLARGEPGPPAAPKDVEVLFGAPAVRRVITCAHGGPLTPALIRACCALPEDDEPPAAP